MDEERVIEIKFIGLDNFSRAVYKSINYSNTYFGNVDKLFGNESIEEINKFTNDNLDKIELFGTKFNCEPQGGRLDTWKFVIV